MAKSHSQSSRRWLDRHHSDVYTRQARSEGLRARSAYKLAQIDAKDKLLQPNQVIVDLGAAPGGWTQYALTKIGQRGRVIAVDKLPIEPLSGADIVQGDFTQLSVLEDLQSKTGIAAVDVILSDMAPNFSGIKHVDQLRAVYLAEMALDFANHALKPGGTLLVKLFQGQGFEAYVKSLKDQFAKVVVRKPKASRDKSSEVYLLARNYLRERVVS